MGDQVVLHEDEDFVREQFRMFNINSEIRWEDGIIPMLGKTYPVVPKELLKKANNWVGLPSNDPELGNTWYFPKTTLRKVGHSKLFLFQFICFGLYYQLVDSKTQSYFYFAGEDHQLSESQVEPKIDSVLSDLGDDFKPDFESKSEENVSSMMKVLNKRRDTEKSETQRQSKGK